MSHDLAKKKIELQNRLELIGMTNIAGMLFDNRVALEEDRIEAERELNTVMSEISTYIKSGAA